MSALLLLPALIPCPFFGIRDNGFLLGPSNGLGRPHTQRDGVIHALSLPYATFSVPGRERGSVDIERIEDLRTGEDASHEDNFSSSELNTKPGFQFGT
jgi:hypothetical protein